MSYKWGIVSTCIIGNIIIPSARSIISYILGFFLDGILVDD